jgi:hypothetical protein
MIVDCRRLRGAGPTSTRPRLSWLGVTLIKLYHKYDMMQVNVAKMINSRLSCIEVLGVGGARTRVVNPSWGTQPSNSDVFLRVIDQTDAYSPPRLALCAQAMGKQVARKGGHTPGEAARGQSSAIIDYVFKRHSPSHSPARQRAPSDRLGAILSALAALDFMCIRAHYR